MKVIKLNANYKNIHNAICFIHTTLLINNHFIFCFVKNGQIHHHTLPAQYIQNKIHNNKYYFLHNLNYGSKFSKKSWTNFARKQILNIFL